MKCKKTTYVISTMLLMTLLFTMPVKAQVKIGGDPATPPNGSAVLELATTEKYGLLLPKLSLDSTRDASVLAGNAHVAGMLIYNTNATNTGTNDVSPGVYYNDGTKWVPANGGQAAPAAKAFKVIEVTDNATVDNDVDLIKVTLTAPLKVLTLPIGSNAPAIGKMIYVINYSNYDMATNPMPLSNFYTGLPAGGSITLMYLGNDIWDIVSGF